MVLVRRLLSRLGEDLLLLVLLLSLLPLWWHAGVPAAQLPTLVQWPTVAALAGLMVLSRALELSGWLDRLGQRLVQRVHSGRSLALLLVWLSALLSALITNDVALFIVVPLTLALAPRAGLDPGRLVIFEALAVNAGSALSPVGNPQNLFLWQTYGLSFGEFLLAMLPLAVGLMMILTALTWRAFPARRLTLQVSASPVALDWHLLRAALMAYPLFLLAVELGHALPAAALVLAWFGWRHRAVVAGTDWVLLLVFILMFIDLGLLAGLPVFTDRVPDWLALPGGELALGMLLSQLLSNVPATLFLARFTDDWQALAWGVSVGGFGLAIGSLANLIALRLARRPGLWREFHGWSLVMLGLGGALAFLLLPG